MRRIDFSSLYIADSKQDETMKDVSLLQRVRDVSSLSVKEVKNRGVKTPPGTSTQTAASCLRNDDSPLVTVTPSPLPDELGQARNYRVRGLLKVESRRFGFRCKRISWQEQVSKIL